MVSGKARLVGALLMSNRYVGDGLWSWLRPDREPKLKEANKFILGSIIDYQIPSELAWKNAKRLSEDILGDPDDLWGAITSVPLLDWMEKRKEYALHRFPQGHRRVWTIGEKIVSQYGGDARAIWRNQSIDSALHRLSKLGLGEQISRMVAGALFDNNLVQGKGEVKIDRHVRRVLGRVFEGESYTVNDVGSVTELTHQMHPDNPWLLDRPLYGLGKSICGARYPVCANCFLCEHCVFANRMMADGAPGREGTAYHRQEVQVILNTLSKRLQGNYPSFRSAYREHYGWPELDPLRHEVCLCLLCGLNQAAITLTSHVLEAFLKYALIYHDSLKNGKQRSIEKGSGVDGIVARTAEPKTKYMNNDMGTNINLACSAGLITKEEKRQLHTLRDSMRNAYGHADKDRTFADSTVPMQAERDAPIYFRFIDSLVREVMNVRLAIKPD